MKTPLKPAFAILWLTTVLLAAPAASVAQPTVGAFDPPYGARGVDPSTDELAVTFSEPMAMSRWSWCGGGPRFPEVAGDLHFRGERTAVMPVALKPQTTYFLSINCPSAQNFVSASGEPAEITPYHFTTGASPGQMVTADLHNHDSIQELRQLLLEQWSHVGESEIDWEAELAAAEDWLLASPTPEEFAVRLMLFLRPAEDPHLNIVTPEGDMLKPHRRSVAYNGDWNATAAMFNAVKVSDVVWKGRSGDVGFLAVHSWGGENTSEEVDAAMRDLKELPALVIDVRSNGGGDETMARDLAAWFADESMLYARHRFRDPEASDGWTEMRERWFRPNPPGERYDGRVFVLQGPVCLSSNEAFLMMMEVLPNVTTLGATSGGSSANPRRHELANGVQIVLPRWQAFRAGGTPLEGRGVPPDVEVEPGLPGDDLVAQKALELARSEAGER